MIKLLRASGALEAYELERGATLSEQQRERLVDLITWRLCSIEGGQRGSPHRTLRRAPLLTGKHKMDTLTHVYRYI